LALHRHGKIPQPAPTFGQFPDTFLTAIKCPVISWFSMTMLELNNTNCNGSKCNALQLEGCPTTSQTQAAISTLVVKKT